MRELRGILWKDIIVSQLERSQRRLWFAARAPLIPVHRFLVVSERRQALVLAMASWFGERQ